MNPIDISELLSELNDNMQSGDAMFFDYNDDRISDRSIHHSENVDCHESNQEPAPVPVRVPAPEPNQQQHLFPVNVPEQHKQKLMEMFTFFEYLDPANFGAVSARVAVTQCEMDELQKHAGTTALYNFLINAGYFLPDANSKVITYKYLVGVAKNQFF